MPISLTASAQKVLKMEPVEVSPGIQPAGTHYVHLESVLNRPKMDVVAAPTAGVARKAVATPV